MSDEFENGNIEGIYEEDIEVYNEPEFEIPKSHPAVEVSDQINRFADDIARNERRLFAIKILDQTAKYALGSLKTYHIEIIPEYGNDQLKLTLIVHV